MIENLGYVSGLLLGWCGLPQVYESIKSGNTKGVSKIFIWMWLLGEMGMTSYTLLKIGFNGPLLLNYGINIGMILILLKYTYFPRITNV